MIAYKTYKLKINSSTEKWMSKAYNGGVSSVKKMLSNFNKYGLINFVHILNTENVADMFDKYTICRYNGMKRRVHFKGEYVVLNYNNVIHKIKSSEELNKIFILQKKMGTEIIQRLELYTTDIKKVFLLSQLVKNNLNLNTYKFKNKIVYSDELENELRRKELELLLRELKDEECIDTNDIF